nr:hypothetical protein [Tanacetum cinerariifolium]
MALSKNDSKGTCIKGRFERAFVALFDQDIQTFTGSMLLNLDQLEKQLDKEEFQETGSIDAFRALMTQFQTFINFQYYFDDFDVKREDISSNALDADLVVTKSNETESERHILSSKSRNDTHTDDEDINSVDRNTTPESTDMSHRGKEIDQNADAKKCSDLGKVFANVALKNELRKLKGNSVDTKFAKPSILGKPVLQPPRNQSVVRQPNVFKSKRPNFSKQWFASQFDVNNVLSKPITLNYLPKVRESPLAKPHHVNALALLGIVKKNRRSSWIRSDEVLKLKYFKKDALSKLFKLSKQERYEHVGPKVTSAQDGKVYKMAKRDYAWLMISREIHDLNFKGSFDLLRLYDEVRTRLFAEKVVKYGALNNNDEIRITVLQCPICMVFNFK